MRLLFGIVIGAALTIGIAYVHDSKLTGPLARQQQVVNWDVAGRLAGNAYEAVRNQIGEWTGY